MKREIAPGCSYYAHFEDRNDGLKVVYEFAEFMYEPGDPLHCNGRSTERREPAKMRQWIRAQGFKAVKRG